MKNIIKLLIALALFTSSLWGAVTISSQINGIEGISNTNSTIRVRFSSLGSGKFISSGTDAIYGSYIPQNLNKSPIVSSDGGEDTASVSVIENTTLVTTITATDEEGNTPFSYSVGTTLDSAKFQIDSVTGVLSFKQAPNYEVPTDLDNDNIYEVIVKVKDSENSVGKQTISVTITDANDVPTITGLAITTANEDSLYTFSANGDDEDGDILTYSITNKPAWASFDENTGTLSGTPTNTHVGTTNAIVISVKDPSNETASLTAFNLTVVNTNDAPTISGTPILSVNEDSSYSFTPSSNDIDVSDSLSYEIENKPAWANFNPTTGNLSGTPENDDVGLYTNIIISVKDSQNATDSLAPFSLEVINTNDIPTASNITITTNEDTDYTFTIDNFNYIDVDDDALDNIQITSLPLKGKLYNNNVELNINETISKDDLKNLIFKFTPDLNENGNSYSSFTYRVSDGQVYSSTYTTTINVTAINDKPIIVTNLSDENKTENFASFIKEIEILDVEKDDLSLTVQSASDFITLDTSAWSNPIYYLDYNNLNQTLTINSVAKKYGISQVNVQVQDTAGLKDNQDFKIIVPAVLSFPDISDEEISLNEDFGSFDITLQNISLGGESSGTITIVPSDTSIYNVPAPITINSSDAGEKVITLTSKENIFGDTTATITVDNGVNAPTQKTISIKVKSINDAPVISGTPNTGASEDSPYSFTPIVSDVENDTLTFSISNKPAWANFDTSTGVLSGTPSNSDVGKTSNIVISVSDGNLISSLPAFDLIVSNVNDAPTISGTPATSVDEDNPYSFIPTSEDIDGDTLIFSITNKPDWADFDTSTGRLSGIPTNDDVGTTSNIVISVSDSIVSIALAAFDLEVVNTNDAPTITGTPDTSINEDSPYSFIPVGNDVDVGDSITYSIINKPSWASFDTATGAITGTPTNDDIGITSNIIITVTDSATPNASASLDSFDLTVVNTNDAPTITGTPTTSVNEDSTYSFTPTASDVDVGDSLTYSITNKPVWANFNPTTGALSGTPRNEHVGITNNIVITVTDSGSPSASVSLDSFDLEVINTNDAPTINGTPNTNANEDSLYSFTPTAVDVDGDTLVYSITGKPSWASFDTVTGKITGTPTNDHVGNISTITISVKDPSNETATLPAFNLTVVNTNDAPTINGTPNTSVDEDSAYSFTPTANDIDVGDSLSYEIENKPTWANFNTNTGTLSGTPENDDVGVYTNIIISVKDNQNAKTSLSAFNLEVINTNDAPTINGTPDTSVDEDNLYIFTPTTVDVDGDTLVYSIAGKPTWASFDQNSGTLSGTPTNDHVGTTSNITISVKDPSNETAILPAFNITVVNTNDAPTINGSPNTSVNEDSAYSFTPTANDIDIGDSLTYSITNKPIWASFNTSTGVLTGTPRNEHVGLTNNIVITVTDSGMPNASTSLSSFDLEVVNTNDTPTSTNFNISINEDSTYTFKVDDFPFIDVDTNDQLDHIQITVLPTKGTLKKDGLDLNVNDTILKTEIEAQRFTYEPLENENGSSYSSFTFKVNDGNEYSNIFVASISVVAVNDAPVIETNLSDENKVEDFGTFTKLIEISDIENDKLTLEVTTNSDLITLDQSAWSNPIVHSDYDKLNQTLTINSAANKFGTATINVNVTDEDGLDDNKNFKVNIPPVLDFPNISSEVITLDEDFGSFNITLENIDLAAQNSGTITITPSNTSIYNVPTPITVKSSDNGTKVITISSKANTYGNTTAQITVSNGVDAPVSKIIAINITPVNDAPTIISNGATNTANINVVENTKAVTTVMASDIENDTISYSISGGADSAKFNMTNGVLTFITAPNFENKADADANNTYIVEVNATDSETPKMSNTQTLIVTVINENEAPMIEGTPSTTIIENGIYTFTPIVNDVDENDTKIFSILEKPSWASFNTETGTLSGIPTDNHVGITEDIIISVNDSSNNTASLAAFSIEVLNDADKDGIPDITDPDDDNDGIPDNIDNDSDNDGIPNLEEGSNEVPPKDTDNDGVPDFLDPDSDGDGINDIDEGTGDSDNDGIADYADTDSIGQKDSDNDGTPDSLDIDDDNDGISDIDEGVNETPMRDTDKDGIPDFKDIDSDNDGVNDIDEGTEDSNNDGIPDYTDVDSIGQKDSDADGIPDSVDKDDDNDGISDEYEGSLETPMKDTDKDGIPDFKDTDSDGDGVNDAVEGNIDSNNDGIPDREDSFVQSDDDFDNDGIPNSLEGANEIPVRDSDNDGIADFQDGDSDNDGILDSLEGNKDSDNDGIADFIDQDSDNDGILDSQEGTTDTDDDGILDTIDPDDDNDGIPDSIEGNEDIDNDGIPNYKDIDSDGDKKLDEIETTSDSDLDGVPNYLDANDNGSDSPVDNNDGTQTSTFKKVEGSGDNRTTKFTTVIGKALDIEENSDDSTTITVYEPNSTININNNGSIDINIDESEGNHNISVANPGADIDILDPSNNLFISTPIYINSDGSTCQYDIEILQNGSDMITKHYLNRGLNDEVITTVIMKIPNASLAINSDNQVVHVGEFSNTNINDVKVTGIVSCDGSISTTTTITDIEEISSFVAVNEPGSTVEIHTNGDVDTTTALDDSIDEENKLEGLNFKIDSDTGKITTSKVFKDKTTEEVIYTALNEYTTGTKLNVNGNSIAHVDADLSDVRIVTVDVTDDKNNTITSTMQVDDSVIDGNIQRTSNGEDGQIITIVNLGDTEIEVDNKLDGKIVHKVKKEGKTSQAKSSIEGANTVVTSTGVETSFDDSSNSGINTEVVTNIDGETEHMLMIAGQTTKATSMIVGSTTTITMDKTNKPKVITTVETTNTNNQLVEIEVDANSDGSSLHKLDVNGVITQAISEIIGAQTTIKSNGEVETVSPLNSDNTVEANVVANPNGNAIHEVKGINFDTLATFKIIGARTVIKESKEVETEVSLKTSMCQTQTEYIIVDVITDEEGKTLTKFNKYSCTDDSFVETINTTENEQMFEADNKVEVEQMNTEVEIKITTPLDDNIQF